MACVRRTPWVAPWLLAPPCSSAFGGDPHGSHQFQSETGPGYAGPRLGFSGEAALTSGGHVAAPIRREPRPAQHASRSRRPQRKSDAKSLGRQPSASRGASPTNGPGGLLLGPLRLLCLLLLALLFGSH